MKAPDVIYVEFSEDANLAFEEQPFEETPAYIRKDALIKWAKARKAELTSSEPFVAGERKIIKEVVDKIESL